MEPAVMLISGSKSQSVSARAPGASRLIRRRCLQIQEKFHLKMLIQRPQKAAQLSSADKKGVALKKGKHRICPVEKAGSLDNKFRRWIQNPDKILSPYIEKGMTALDIGCGPGFFTIDMAYLVGESGRVIALDLQEGMLQKLKKKIQGTEIEKRITLQKCEEGRIGVSGKVDFILVFYMFHEVKNQDDFLREIESILKPDGQVLIVEPPFHVSKTVFKDMIKKARKAGLVVVETPKVFLSKAVVFKRADMAPDSGGRYPGGLQNSAG